MRHAGIPALLLSGGSGLGVVKWFLLGSQTRPRPKKGGAGTREAV